MSVLTLNLPDGLAEELARASAEDDRPADEIALDLLRRAMAVRRFREVRKRVLAELGDAAPATDEEAFKLCQ